MRFRYQYRTSGNEVRRGEVKAPDREAAFAALKARGIRPSRVDEAPGFFNKLFGRGKRWLAIGALSLALAAAVASALRWRGEARELAAGAAAEGARPLPRRFIRALAASGFDPSGVFAHAHEAYLARYAMPGAETRAGELTDELRRDFEEWLDRPVEVGEGDAPEVAELKSIVEGMKVDARKYAAAPDGIVRFCEWLEERQTMERDYRERLVQRVRRGELTEEEANSVFRAMGLEEIE